MSLEDIKATRLEKLEKLKKAGIDPYPARSSRTHTITQAIDSFEDLAEKKEIITLAGRVMAKREQGGLAFVDINDGSAPSINSGQVPLTTGGSASTSAVSSVPNGSPQVSFGKIQILLKKDDLGEEAFGFFFETVDIGDFIEASGTLFKTKREERTLLTTRYSLLTKSLLPLPEKWHGLQDVEERYRKRYLDLIFNPETRAVFEARSKIIEHIRQFLLTARFMEVETPMLQTLYGGANARPFKTHLNTLDIDLYLRIAPELYLKRLLVGGFERVFEIGRNFRNEGMDREHNPEFTMLEFYAAYWDYEKMMEFVEGMFEHVVEKKFGTVKIKHQGREVDFKKPYARVEFNDLFKKYSGIDYDESDEDELKAKAKELDIKIEKSMTKGNLGDEIYKKVARPNIIEPTFIINHPVEISPLAKKLKDNDKNVARFQLIAGGMELTNGFSELNDPTDQCQRFEAQEKFAKKGNEEAQRLDEDYIEALEHGMPPAAGVGIGLDRLVALLTDSHSIREVILFPLMKPRS